MAKPGSSQFPEKQLKGLKALETAVLRARKSIQKLNKDIAGYRTLQQQSIPDASYWQHAPSRALEADPWSSLVLLSAILVDFVGVALRRPKK